MDTKCGLEHQLIKASASYHNEKLVEITERKDVSFADLEKAYEWILREGTDRILFLFDEAGSLSTKFFNEEGDSYFEILMNQLRTLKESEIKIAVYPHTASDKLKNVKFGQPIVLKENIYNIDGYKKFRNKVIELVDRYLENYSINCKLHANNIFEMHESNEFGDSIEQLIFGSNGVMRYFVYYADIAMKICDSKNKSKN
ncbi:hypothetical protein [Ruminiclostridium josui]|uniref:hypothetical protein n=1 Tax=Ruminiclostridium josui TaxID=1499 RepID=UPI0006CFD9C2|nr:hypothetical protein [Ruminiclostridium josui]